MSLRTISVKLQQHPLTSKINHLHGVNGSPKNLFPGYPDLDDQFNVMGIKNIRTHDWFGIADLDGKIDPNNVSQPIYSSTDKSTAQKLFADISNKRTMVLNASKGTGLNFEPTDIYLKTLMSNIKNVDIMFRIGRSLSYSNIYPTSGEDLNTYVSLVKQVVQRYSIDYKKHGLPKAVQYWEIGNEDDIGDFWSGNTTDFYTYFSTIYKAIKSVDPTALVGGSGLANPLATNQDFMNGFLKYCDENNIGLDFFSWHHYCDGSSDPYDYFLMGRDVRKYLDNNNFKSTKSYMTEWNMTPSVNMNTVSACQTMLAASFICSALIYLQDSYVDISYFYRSDAMHLGMFNKEHSYSYTSKTFIIFNELISTPYRLAANTVGRSVQELPKEDAGQDSLGFTVLAGTDTDISKTQGNRTIKILLSNYQIDRNYVNNYNKTFQQYSIDTSQDADHINSSLYYGGQDPTKLNNVNDPTIKSDHHYPAGGLALQKLNYSDNQGLKLQITIPSEYSYKNYSAKYEWLTENSNLDITALETLSSAPSSKGTIPSNRIIEIDRPELTAYRILLVTINLS